MELKGKAAVITGASAGIGAAMARNLAEAGMRLVLTGRREERLRALAGEVGGAEVLAGEITDRDMPGRLIQRALEAYGSCDVVLNNAGIMTAGPIEEIDIELICEMARINVEASFRMIYTAVRHFKQVGSGYLISTGSVLGTKVRVQTGGYCGTKAAVEALTEGLRMELAGTDIRVACIEPGLALTEIHRDFPVHPIVAQGYKNPLMPEDVARCVRFMLEQPGHVGIPRLMLLSAEQEV